MILVWIAFALAVFFALIYVSDPNAKAALHHLIGLDEERCSRCGHLSELHYGKNGEYCEQCPDEDCDSFPEPCS